LLLYYVFFWFGIYFCFLSIFRSMRHSSIHWELSLLLVPQKLCIRCEPTLSLRRIIKRQRTLCFSSNHPSL